MKTDEVYVVSTPYVNHIAPKIKQMSKNTISTLFSVIVKKVIFCFVKCKDMDDLKLRSNVIYEISCKNCTNVYIGQTKRYMKKPIYEHKNKWKKEPKHYTALTKHQLDEFHYFNFDKIKILGNEKNY